MKLHIAMALATSTLPLAFANNDTSPQSFEGYTFIGMGCCAVNKMDDFNYLGSFNDNETIEECITYCDDLALYAYVGISYVGLPNLDNRTICSCLTDTAAVGPMTTALDEEFCAEQQCYRYDAYDGDVTAAPSPSVGDGTAAPYVPIATDNPPTESPTASSASVGNFAFTWLGFCMTMLCHALLY